MDERQSAIGMMGNAVAYAVQSILRWHDFVGMVKFAAPYRFCELLESLLVTFSLCLIPSVPFRISSESLLGLPLEGGRGR